MFGKHPGDQNHVSAMCEKKSKNRIFGGRFSNFYEFWMTKHENSPNVEAQWLTMVAYVVHIFDMLTYSEKRKALGVIPRGKQWLTVYRAPQVTRRAFLSSKSNTAARAIEFQHASQKVGKIDDKMKISQIL